MTTNRLGAADSKGTRHDVHVSDYLRVLYRRRWAMALVIVVVFVHGAFQTLKKTPIYQASAQLLILGENRRSTSLSSVLDSEGYSAIDFYQTQHRILQSRALAWRTVQSLGLDKVAVTNAAPVPAPVEERSLVGTAVDWIKEAIDAPEPIALPPPDEATVQAQVTGRFLSGLSIVPIRNTSLVEVRYMSSDPAFTARAANALAEEYIEQTLDARLGASREAMGYLSTQLEEQRQRVTASELALQDYKENNDAIGVDDQQNIVVQRLQGLNAQYMLARAERIDKEARYTSMSSLENRGALDSFPDVVGSDSVQELRSELGQLRRERADLRTRYREGAVQIAQMDERIQDVERKLQSEIGTVVNLVNTELMAAKAREASLSQELTRQKNEAMALNRKGIEYAALRDEAASNRQLYESLLQRTNEAEVTGEFKGTNIQIIDRAVTPRSPILPDTRGDLTMALLWGFGIATALAFGLEYLDNRIRSPEEIQGVLGLTFLGLVPAASTKKMDGNTPLISSHEEVPHDFEESIRAVRTALMFSMAEEGARSVVVTSTGPGEGKTVVASNLAVSLAQAGQRTLLMDADMRRPRVHEVFNARRIPGLSNVIVGNRELRDVIVESSVPNLLLLSAGHVPPNPAELLGSLRFHELLAELRCQFDWILIDVPPVLAVTDAAVVANEVSGVVFVVGAEMTSRRNAVAARDRLASAHAHMLGGVLNRVNVRRHSYYYSTHYRKDYTKAYARSR